MLRRGRRYLGERFGPVGSWLIVTLAGVVGVLLTIGGITLVQPYTSAWRLSHRARVYLMEGEYGKAINACEWGIWLYPDFGFFYEIRGEVYEAQGDLEKSVVDYSKGLEIDSQNSLLLTMRGRVREAMGESDNAVADYSRALLSDPDSVFLPEMVAYTRARRCDSDALDELIALFEKAIRCDPSDARLRKSRSVLSRAKEELSRGRDPIRF